MAQVTVNAKAAEIVLFGEITTETAKEVDAGLKALPSTAATTIRLNSPGGDVFAGAAIHSMLSRRSNVTVLVDGLAASAASFLAMAAARIVMAPAAMLMIHDPVALSQGGAGQMANMARLLESVRDQMARAYANRSGQSIETIIEMMALETWMTSEEAVNFGFADSVEGKASIAALKAAAHFNLRRYLHPPERTIADLAAAYWGSRGKPASVPLPEAEAELSVVIR
ncbi:MAG TPA: head maturation protease, ClpP-related [Devosia sp.]|nr:head maturation protease, ClpP-related [Devosia sp.]